MVLHSRAKEFILITADEYSSLLSLRKTEQSDPDLPAVKFEALESNQALESTKQPILESGKASLEFPSASEWAQWNLNSRFRKRPQASSISDVKKVEAASQLSKSENVIIELLSVGLSGGKVERSRQILRKINEAENVSIDKSSGRILLHDRDTGVSIFDFLYYLQTTTKTLNEATLDLIRRLKLPDFLLANTNAKRAAAEVKTSLNDHSAQDQSISFSDEAKWLRLY